MSRAQKSDEEIQALAKKQLRLPQTISVRRYRLLSVSRTVSNEIIPQNASLPQFYVAELKKHARIFPDDMNVRGYCLACSPLHLFFLSRLYSRLRAFVCRLLSRFLSSHRTLLSAGHVKGGTMTRYVTYDTRVTGLVFWRYFVLTFPARASRFSVSSPTFIYKLL